MKTIFAILLSICCFEVSAAEPKTNVVFILVDDLGVNDLSLYGSKFFETPHIDALARRGMKFTSAYSASPLCSPTRSSILSGLHPARLGITAPDCHLPKAVLEKKLNASAPPTQKALTAQSVTRFATGHHTLAKAFKAEGYATAHFGKWHLGPEPFSPLEHGFDVDIPHTSAPSPLGNGFFYPFPVWKNHGKPGDNLEDMVCDQAVKFIEQHKDKPFFLNYWAFEVHSPWQAKESQIAKYRGKAKPDSLQRNPVYAGMVETLDEVVGRLVAALEKAGVLERTVIVFTSDNGPYFIPNREHMPAEFHAAPVTSAQPLRAGKGTIYEAGTRVPLLVVWPGRVKPGSTSDAPVQSTDFFPTFADALGWKLPDSVHLDGVSQQRVLEGGGPVRKEIFCHFPHAQARGDYEQMPAPTPATPASSLRQGDWKLIRLYCDNADRTDRHELYNLADDPGERSDLSSTQPERVKQLAVRLDAVLKETDAVIPKANPAFDPARVPAGKPATKPAAANEPAKPTLAADPLQQDWFKRMSRQANAPKPEAMLVNTDVEPALSDGFTSLCDGKSLEGWTVHGGKSKFSVADGCVVGVCEPGTPSTYLCTKQSDFSDFVFTCEMKMVVPQNSGVMFRARLTGTDKNVVAGPQFEMEPFSENRDWSGGIYGQGCGGWFYPLWLQEHAAARKAQRDNDWNRVTIEARGPVVKTWLNGVPTAHWHTEEYLKGYFGLQLHKDQKGHVLWRNPKIKPL